MVTFLQQVLNGLTLGCIYALVALGYTLVYGILELINFAHGDLVMIGALVSLSLVRALQDWGAPLPVALAGGLVGAMGVCVLVGVALERLAYRPLRHAPKLAPLITAIGMSMVLEQGSALIWGRGYRSFPDLGLTHSLTLGGVVISPLQGVIVLGSLSLLGGLLWLIQRSALGRAMRATAQNPVAAQLLGVDTERVITLAFVIGAALAAIAGLMVGAYYQVAHYTMGFMLGLKAFTAAVLGGIGNLSGAVLGGILLGLLEALGAGYLGDWTGNLFGSNYKDVFSFATLILVLLFHPSGLLGRHAPEKV
ncbi:branched-chain amino acid ABC transporter permease [Ferrovum myxofaciens]|jgi:branched-chain amino acid transport system permease protein|uniref:Branched-chain amino acid ABC transporter permease n=2 Tax=root TaxID=1 RepID=A0A859A9W6_9PROT|nr:branched-chain amino acid ABC transporter permease [Ferrovum myxofaciens]KXW58512.1 high-affinity branched-chain amino acid transport system permease protein LivH [Ferrovum myxofaciens]QKE38429.1 MAG: branched-chain amino acid ABC transporter permease [Ferrovum myxofaciens]QKE40963.1 MAG: branched-chain amino acid ABC transporter permease [Ferrovum myxofaciens]QWY73612.1 MAG: branched-chain amino acid ABC transporter permease [Ferrovum myxofaciens]QWY76366.1 MAG: branched-chain amino acid A